MCILLLLILVNSFQVHRMIIYKHIIVVNIHVSKLVRIYSYHSLMCTGLPRSFKFKLCLLLDLLDHSELSHSINSLVNKNFMIASMLIAVITR